MAIAAKSAVKFNAEQLTATVREAALRAFEVAQVKFDKAQQEGRVVLSRQIQKGAERASDLSTALTELSKKVAPAAKPKAAPRAKAKPVARKAVAKTVAKPRARKVAAA